MGKKIDMATLPRIEHPDDPNRCTGSRPMGQCQFLIIPNTKFCPLHGHWHVSTQQKKNVFKYRTTMYQARLDDLTTSSALKSLKEEIGILRLLVEKHLDGDLEITSTAILRLTKAISNLSTISARVETTLSKYVDHESAIDLAKNACHWVEVFAFTESQQVIDEVSDLLDRLNKYNDTARTMSNYTQLRFKEEVQRFISEEKVTNLRNEIGVMRLIIEQTLNACDNEAILITKAEHLTKLIVNVAELIQTTNKLETSFGLLLDEEAANTFTQELITIIGKHVTQTDKLSLIASKLLGDLHQPDFNRTDALGELLAPDPVEDDDEPL